MDVCSTFIIRHKTKTLGLTLVGEIWLEADRLLFETDLGKADVCSGKLRVNLERRPVLPAPNSVGYGRLRRDGWELDASNAGALPGSPHVASAHDLALR